MTWKNNGGSQGPWGQQGPSAGGPRPQGPSGGGQPQPDMEEILRRSQEKLREMFPAGGNGGGRGAALVVAAVFVLWLLSGIYKVQPEEQGVVMRFGEFHRVTDPGLRYHLPAPFEAVLKPPVTRVNMIEVGFRSNGSGTRDGQPRSIAEESMMLTGDENIIDINFKVQWKIRDAKQFLFNVRNPEVTVKNAAESAMRESIGQTPIASALSDGRLAIEQSAQGLLQNILNNYQAGIEVIGVQMLDVNPPAAVIDAFRDVQTAQADAERAINQAEAYANDILPKARGAAEQKTLDAQAYRQRVVAQSEGEAARFASIYNEYKNASAVTRQRLYIEAMEEVMKNTPKVVIDSSVKGLVPFLPLGEMMKKEAKGTTNE